MAFCPSVRKEMGQIDTICPHCGYDFPDHRMTTGRAAAKSGWAYSGAAADLAPVAGQLVSACRA